MTWCTMQRMHHSDANRLTADVAAIDASFGVLAGGAAELDRGDGARGAHLKQIGQPFAL